MTEEERARRMRAADVCLGLFALVTIVLALVLLTAHGTR